VTAERERTIERICQAALEHPVAERAAIVAEACRGDESLRREVEALLGQEGASAFLETPALAVAAHGVRAMAPALGVGQRLGVYTIVAALDAGGMGEVYRARDTRLGRDVAIKVLPSLFTGDTDRLARLEREARVLAALNHPNIATIHGVERLDSSTGSGQALVLELVEGETLYEQLQHGPLPLDKSLTIAKQIAEALEAAHGNGIVHRDLKPANIKIRPDQVVKVLDFGLAKVLDHEPGGPGTADTLPGVVVGTAAYMAPEQATGQTADARSDIWAFGLLVYEMLTGRSGFAGETVPEVLANVQKAEPDWTALPPTTPPAIRSLVRRCLQKDRSRRLRDIADARFQIEEALSEPAAIAAVNAPAKRARERLAWAAALVGVGVVAVISAFIYQNRPRAEPPEMRLEITAPPTADPASLAISPDGRTIAFVATSEGQSRLWVRGLDAESARPLAATVDAQLPFWSPDSRSLGFFVGTQLKRIDVDSGDSQTLASVWAPGGGTWNRDGTILFSTANVELFRVPATGGESAKATTLTQEARSHRLPQFLPDGRHFLFHALGTLPGIYGGQLGSSETRRLVEADTAAYAPSGYLLFVRQGTLFAQPFDAARLELTGTPNAVAQHIVMTQDAGSAALSASAAGPIVYRRGTIGAQRHLEWVDRAGKMLETVPSSDWRAWGMVALSPDGRTVVFYQVQSGTADIWLQDLGRGVRTRLTSDPAFDLLPIWSPDGSRIAFASNRRSKREFDMYLKSATGAGVEEMLPGHVPDDWSSDGRFLLSRTEGNLFALPLEGDRKPFAVAQTSFVEVDGRFSPDGRWVAYLANDTGRFEVYLQRFPRPGRRWQISAGGGVQPLWRRDGKELFFLAPDNTLMAVPIQLDPTADSIDAGTPVPLFTPRLTGNPQTFSMRHYAASPDGQRFLIDTPIDVTVPITVLLNWKPAR
jgi:serine/threonine protein kinase/Tol biopolymer transport system component